MTRHAQGLGVATDLAFAPVDIAQMSGPAPKTTGAATSQFREDIAQGVVQALLKLVKDDTRAQTRSRMLRFLSRGTNISSVRAALETCFAELGEPLVLSSLSSVARLAGPIGWSLFAAQIGTDIGQYLNTLTPVQNAQQSVASGISSAYNKAITPTPTGSAAPTHSGTGFWDDWCQNMMTSNTSNKIRPALQGAVTAGSLTQGEMDSLCSHFSV